MSKFAPRVRFETQFQGDTVIMNLKSLSRKDFFRLMPYLENADEHGEIPQQDAMNMVNAAAEWMPKYVSDFSGLKDADGNAVGLDTVLEEVFFIELVSEIVSKVVEISQVQKPKPGQKEKDTELGKSAGPLPA